MWAISGVDALRFTVWRHNQDMGYSCYIPFVNQVQNQWNIILVNLGVFFCTDELYKCADFYFPARPG